jgi:hypothetical protein
MMSELSMRLRGFAYDLHVVADGVEALEAEVERLRVAIRDFINATTSRASGTWSTDDVRALRALRATLEASHDPNDSK